MESNDDSEKGPDNPEWSETSDMDISGSSDSEEEEQLNTAFVGNSVESAGSQIQADGETIYYEMPEADGDIPMPADGLEEPAAPESPTADELTENPEVPNEEESEAEKAGADSESENEEQPEVQPDAEYNSEEILRGEQLMHEIEFAIPAAPTEDPVFAGHLTILEDTEFKTAIEEEESGEESNNEAEEEDEDQGEAEEVNEPVVEVDEGEGKEEDQGEDEDEDEEEVQAELQQEDEGEAEDDNDEQVEADQGEDEEENEQMEVADQGEDEEENEQIEADQREGHEEAEEEDEQVEANQGEGQEETLEDAEEEENLDQEAVEQGEDQDEEKEDDLVEETDQGEQLQALEEDASVDLEEDDPASPDVTGEEEPYQDASPGESVILEEQKENDEEASDDEQKDSDGEESLQEADVENGSIQDNLGQEKKDSAEKDDMLDADTILRGEKILGELYYTVTSEPEESEQQVECEDNSEGNESAQQEESKKEEVEDMDTDQMISIPDIQTEETSSENGKAQLLECDNPGSSEVVPDKAEEVSDAEPMDVDESPDKSKAKPVSNADFWETPKKKKREVLVAKRLKDGKKKKDSKKAGDGSKKVKKSKEKSNPVEEIKTPKRKRSRSPSKPPKTRKKTTLTPETVKRRKIDPSLTATPSQLRKPESSKSSTKKKCEKHKKKKDKKISASGVKDAEVAERAVKEPEGATKEPEVAEGAVNEPEVAEGAINEPGISRGADNDPEPPGAAATGSVLNPPYDPKERSSSEPFVRFVCPDGEFCMLRTDLRLVDERLRKFVNQKGAEAGNEVVVYFPSYGRKVLKKLVETLSTINFFGEKKYRLNLALFPSDDDFDFGNKDCRNCKLHHRCVKCCYFCCCCCPKMCYDGQFITCKCINGQRYSKVSKKRGDKAGFLESEGAPQQEGDLNPSEDKSNQMPQQATSDTALPTTKETEYQKLISEEVPTCSMSERAEQGTPEVIEACLWKLQTSGIKIATRPKGDTRGKFVRPKEPVKKAVQKPTLPVAKQPALKPMPPKAPKKPDSNVGPVTENSVAEKAQGLPAPEEVPEVVHAEPDVKTQEEPMELDIGSMLSPEVVLEEDQDDPPKVAEKPTKQESIEVDVTPPPPTSQVGQIDQAENTAETIIPQEKSLEEEKEALTKEEPIPETSKKQSRSPSSERSSITAKKLKLEDEGKEEDVLDKDKEKEKEKEKKKKEKKKDKDRDKKEECTRSRSRGRDEDKDKDKKRKSSRKDKDKEKEGKREKDRKSRKDRSRDRSEKRDKSPDSVEGNKEKDKNRSLLDKKEKEQEKIHGNEETSIEKGEEKKEEHKDQEVKYDTQEESSMNNSSGQIKADEKEAGPSTSGGNPQNSSSKPPSVQPGKPDVKGASKRPVSLNAFPHLTVAGGFHARPSTESKMITDHPVVCEYCPRERIFATKANLNKHISVFHPGVRQALNQLPPAALAKKKDPRRRLLARAAGLPSSSEDEDDEHKRKSTSSQQEGKKGASSSSSQQNLFICPQCKSRFKTHKGYMGHMEKHKMENSKLGPPVHIK